MKVADLYIRVSTDEQADKGYSQRNQEELLRKYCSINSIEVRKIIYEDYSAKTFERPSWQKLLSDLRKRRGQSDLILFTKWDRFSRNAGDAYQMISILRKLGIEPQAIEQPLDLSIPENKMMLAFYLAAPEVENDRRALNVFYGMRRAKKEGRWMATAPIGYINKTSETGRKYIAPEKDKAAIIKWAFKEIANGIFAADQIRQEMNKKGVRCSRSNFWTLIRNPVYCGMIHIDRFKDEDSSLVQAQHAPIISESLFYEVQDVLSGRKRKERSAAKMITEEIFPLRGFLICPKCGRMLTGSSSKGRREYYYYYHCVSSCGCRFKANDANDLFVRDLRKYVPRPGMSNLYVSALSKSYNDQTQNMKNDRKQILFQIEEYSNRLKNARKLFADEKMDEKDFRELKAECLPTINSLEGKLSGLTMKESNIDELINSTLNNLAKLDCLYIEGDIQKKREIIGSIYPEKLTFDGNQYRTARVNEAVRLIYTLDKCFSEIKNRKEDDILCLSGGVVPTGIEPVSKV